MRTVHKPLPHDAARLHVTGEAVYVDDIPLPANTLHLAFGLSTVAHGDILALDLDEVRQAEGVVAVLTASGLPAANDVSPAAHDEPLLAIDKVHFVGQPVFLVAAESHLQARRAAALGRISYRQLPSILSIEDALAADSQLEPPLNYRKGNPEQILGKAPHIVSGRIGIGGQEHFYLEGQVALAVPLEGGDMLIHSSSQHPTEIQHKVAEAIGRPMHAVRTEVRRMGGGFGGKESQGNAPACACAVMAMLTGSACKMRYDRDDDMAITGKRHDAAIRYRAGFDDDGRIQAVEYIQDIRCGWSRDLSLPVADRAMLHADNCYNLPAVSITSTRLRTNTQSATAFRGFGGPQGMLGCERVLDHIAFTLGKDPAEVRKVNFYAPQNTPRPDRTFYDMPVEDCVIDDIIEELMESCGYAERRAEIRAWNRERENLRRGIALSPVKFGISFTLTHLNQAGALVHVYQDGSIHINHGGTEMGQGLFIKVAQVAAEAFGQPMEAVKITATDTGKVPNTSPTAASSGSDLNGMAVKRACDEITGRLVDLLASLHQVKPAEVKFRNGGFEVGGGSYSFGETIKLAYMNRVSLSATGFYATPKVIWDRIAGKGRPFFYFAYGAAVSEVVIDTLTGENRILRADILHDVGKSLNPAIDIGQIEGGYVQGAGWLTTEELVWNADGKLMTHAPSTYKIPACSDRPREFNIRLWEQGRNREHTVYRSKAVGEPPLMLGISAFLALSDAVAACGDGSVYPHLDAPATPERILAAVARQQGVRA
ncbi:MAG: xanthine dehydrogenase molybdopterin binding subunit [Rhodobacteraceae bacterium]|nr:xanthine dehydrogenase molybdopterin binding subunit [Paracoccaceae bacterium]